MEKIVGRSMTSHRATKRISEVPVVGLSVGIIHVQV